MRCELEKRAFAERTRQKSKAQLLILRKQYAKKTEKKMQAQEMDAAHREKQCIKYTEHLVGVRMGVWKTRLSPSPCPWEDRKTSHPPRRAHA